MTEEQPYHLCPTCGQRVERDDPGTRYAVELVDMPAMGKPHDWVDGMGAFIHPGAPRREDSPSARTRIGREGR